MAQLSHLLIWFSHPPSYCCFSHCFSRDDPMPRSLPIGSEAAATGHDGELVVDPRGQVGRVFHTSSPCFACEKEYVFLIRKLSTASISSILSGRVPSGHSGSPKRQQPGARLSNETSMPVAETSHWTSSSLAQPGMNDGRDGEQSRYERSTSHFCPFPSLSKEQDP